MKISLKILVTCIFLCMHPVSFAQFQIPFINYTTDNGLLQSQISGICQDTKGYMWFATAEGVSRFDGKNFRNFTVEDGLPARMATAILADRRGRVWVATQGGGLAVFNGRSFRTYSVQEGLASNNISTTDRNSLLLEDKKGNIWCRTSDGISVVAGDSVSTFSNEQLKGLVACFAEDDRGRIICGMDQWITIIDDGRVTHHLFQPDFGVVMDISTIGGNIWVAGSNQRIARLKDDQWSETGTAGKGPFITSCADSQGDLWLSTVNEGVYCYTGERFVPFEGIRSSVVRIYEDRNQNIWFLTPDHGVYRYDRRMLHHYEERYGLVGDQTKYIFEDSGGNVWIGTDNGISMYGKVIFETLTTTSGLPNNHIVAVAAAPDGSVWCSPQSSGLVNVKGQETSFYEYRYKERMPRANFFISLAAVKDGLLLGTFEEGVGVFRNGTIEFNNSRQLDRDINHILVDGNQYWLATSKGLACMKEDGATVTYTAKDGLPDDFVNFLARDGQGRIWCTTSLGISVFDGKRFTNYTTANGLPNNSCTDIEVDKYGRIWVGTIDGLCRITLSDGPPVFKTYTIRDGLASNSISMVHANQSERLWVGHVNGLNTIDLNTDSIRYYGRDDGYFPMDCYQGAAATDTEGNVWFGTVAGLSKYVPSGDIKRTTPPLTYITGISLLSGEDIGMYADSIAVETGLPVKLSLPHDKNVVQIDWIGLHYTIPVKNRYRYILEGYDKTWHEESTETTRDYQLSPGKYTFKVMACNNEGVWNDVPVGYSFVVRPPWWTTIVAYIAYVVILLVLIYLYVRWRERSLKEKNRILEEKVYERTIEIELQKQNILEINKELTIQRDQIDEQRTEIMDSIYYAKRIQTAIMPKPEQLKEILDRYFLFFKPRNVVSGDYYWAARKDDQSVVIVADCTGHGVPGAFMSMLGISILNEIVLKQSIGAASQILEELRANLKIVLSQTGAAGEQHDGMDAALCMIDYQAMELQYSGAYNSLYIVRNNELIEFKADKMPVGIHIGKEKPFTNHIIRLEHNDMLYIFSDGYVDQFGGPDDSKFKTKPFKQLLTEIAHLPEDRQKEILVERHDKWKGSRYQIDDIIVMGIRIE